MTIAADLRFAIRTLRRTPGFVMAVLLLLALGIGANTAIFSVVEAVLLRPLPYPDSARLCMLFKSVPAKHLDWDWTSYPTIRDWRQQNRTFSDIAFVLRPEGSRVTLTSGDQPETVQGSKVSRNLFPLLGVPPLVGRTFSESADRGPAVVLSYRLWQQRFGGSPDVPGRPLEIDRVTTTIIGVMPESFRFPDPGAQLWLLIEDDTRWTNFQQFRVADAFAAVGRLKAGIDLGQARSDLDVIAARLASQYADTDAGLGVRVLPLADRLTPPYLRRSLWILMAAVGCVLLMTCLNVAGLVLARGHTRQRELAVRTALGAGRAHLVRQLFTESLVLSFAGGALGLLLSVAVLRALIRIAPTDLSGLATIGVDPGLLLFAILISILSGLCFGLVPSIRLARPDPQEVLHGGGRGSTGPGRARSLGMLVAAEFAAAVVLLTGSGLLIRSFLRIQAVHLGFDPTRLAIADVHLPSPRYDQPERVRSFFEQATSRIAALPGVTGVAVGGLFSDHQPNAILQIEGRADAAGPEPHGRQYVSKEYFRLLGIPLERGRLFSALDHEHSAPTAVINSSMARRFWPNQDPLGKRFRQTLPGLDGGDWLTVVGVVGDVVLNGRESRAVPMFYRPRSQIGFGDASLLVRSAQDPLLLQAAVRHELQLLDPTVPRFEIDTVERRLTSMESSRRFETELLSLFALLALVLAVIGIYGLLHFAVTQRTREVGIRIALGAERTHVIRLILRQGLGWALLGVAVGALAARWMTALLADLLFGVTATDPGTFIAVTFALLLVAAVAAGLPAHRASAIDPLIALREE